MIKLNMVTKIYGENNGKTVALKDINLEINAGEFISIMGTSGSGKSTLLNIIGGMDTITSGKYYFKNSKNSSNPEIKIHELSSKKLEQFRNNNISFVFQNFALMEKYNIYENIELPLVGKNIEKKKRKKRTLELAEQLGIRELLNKYPFQISGGQQQRVAIARALAAENPIILADEPTGALDEENTVNLMGLLKEINSNGKTIIVVTHDLKVAKYCNRIITLTDGRIEGENIATI